MSEAALVTQYAGAFLPTSHPARPALERAAADGLCTLEWLPRGAVRVIAPWQWPTRETMDDGPIVWP